MYRTCFVIVTFILLVFALQGQGKVQSFLPEHFSGYAHVRDIAISPEGKEIYFTLDSYKSEIGSIAYIKKEDEGWSEPEIVSFSGKYRDLEPAFSSDGKTLYFASNRPVHKDSTAPNDYNIWKVVRDVNSWSSAVVLDTAINTEYNEFYPSVAKSGNIYFTSDRPTEVGRENIYLSEFGKEGFKDAIPLGEGINSKYYEFNAFVAPDESFLLFSAIRPKEGVGGGDLYISFNQNGWQKAQPLKLVNTPYLDFCPFVDVKTNTLYFTSQKTELPKFSKEPLKASFFSGLRTSALPKGLNRLYSIDFEQCLPNQDE